MFQSEVITIYKKMSPKLAEEYSAAKFGDPKIISSFSSLLAKRIAKYFKANAEVDYIIFASQKKPVNSYYTKTSVLMAKQIGRLLDKRVILGEYSYKYNPKTFYDNQLERKSSHVSIIKNKNSLKKHNYTVVMVDDSVLSRASFTVNFSEFKQFSNNAVLFSIIDLKDVKKREAYFNELFFVQNGVKGLVKIANNRSFDFTSQFLRTLDKMPKPDKTYFYSKIAKGKQTILKKAYFLYFGKPFSPFRK
jgi:hypothetical protein